MMITVTAGTVYAPQGLFVAGQSLNVPPADAARCVSLGVATLAPGVLPTSGSLANWTNRGEQNLGAFPQGSISFSSQPVTGSSITLSGTGVGFVTSGPIGNQIAIAGNLSATIAALATFLNASVDPNISLATYAATATALNIFPQGVAFAVSASTAPASNGISQNGGP